MEIVHPPADWLTPTRVETLLNFLPTGLATVITYHSSRGQDMLVHDLRGGKCYVPHHMVTIKDLLSLLVEEEGREHSTKVAATLAFNNISIFPRESWLAATARFVQFYKASTVDPAIPYASEEAYFWSQLPVDHRTLHPSAYRSYGEGIAAQPPQGIIQAGNGSDAHSQARAGLALNASPWQEGEIHLHPIRAELGPRLR